MSMRKEKASRNVLHFLLFAGPAVFCFLAVVIIPFLYGIYLSFTSWDGMSQAKPFAGLANYAYMFRDTAFWASIGKTMLYVLIATALVNLAAFLMALLVTGKIRGKNFFRAGFFIPNLIGGIILGYIWQYIFNRVIPSFDLPGLGKSMLSAGPSAFIAIVIVSIWQYAGYMMLIYIAGMTGVSDEVKEAAKIDGCTDSQVTRYIILPLMRQSFTICLFLTITRCFMIYDVNLSLTAGGPGGKTTMAAMYVYNMAFASKQYGPGQAEAIVLFVLAAVIAVTQAVITSRKEVEA